VHSAGGCGSSAATIAAIVAIMNTAARYLYLEITAKSSAKPPGLHRPSEQCERIINIGCELTKASTATRPRTRLWMIIEIITEISNNTLVSR
jgi:hypothetical protein